MKYLHGTRKRRLMYPSTYLICVYAELKCSLHFTFIRLPHSSGQGSANKITLTML